MSTIDRLNAAAISTKGPIQLAVEKERTQLVHVVMELWPAITSSNFSNSPSVTE